MDVRKIYEYALQREHEGKSFFQQNAKRFSHAAVAGAFEKLAEEEQKHIEFIQSLIASLDTEGEEAMAKGSAMDAEGFFSQRAESELLDQTIIEAMVPDLSVLRVAYLIERDFADFYEMAARDVADRGNRQALEMLAKWELGHELLFKSLHDQAFQEYAGMPWGG